MLVTSSRCVSRRVEAGRTTAVSVRVLQPERAPRAIAVLSPLLGGTYHSRVMIGIVRAAAARGVPVVGVQTVDTARAPFPGAEPGGDDCSQRMAWSEILGAVVLVDPVHPQYLRGLIAAGIPVVTVAHEVPGLTCPVLSGDNRGGASQAVRHLLEHGHRRVAFVGNVAHDDMKERYEAYREALRRHGIEPDERLAYLVDDNLEPGGEKAARAMLDAGLPSTAVFVATDYGAIGMMQELKAAGLVLPRDQAIVAFDDEEESSAVTPSLSTVRVDLAEVGAAAVRLVLRGGGPGATVGPRHLVPTWFVVRESCGCSLYEGSTLRLRGDAAAPPRSQAPRSPGRAPCPPRIGDHAAEAVAAACEELAGLLDEPDEVAPERLESIAQRALPPEARWEHVPAAVARASELAETRGRSPRERQGLVTTFALALSHAYLSRQAFEKTGLGQSLRDEYHLSMDLLRRDRSDPKALRFLSRSHARAACLALWHDGDPKTATLEVAGTYSVDGPPPVACGEVFAVEEFPPGALVQDADAADGEATLVLPVRSGVADYGVLAIVAPVEPSSVSGRDFYLECAALLGAALEQEDLVASLLDQHHALRSQQDELRAQQLLLERQKAELQRSEQRLRHQALHDALTGLPNRTLVLERAGQMLASARRRGTRVVALFVDLDDFKQVNDRHGHATGDELLVAVGARLRREVRGADTVGRLSGDEFVILADETGLRRGGLALAERIERALRVPFELSSRVVEARASIGIAVGAELSGDELLHDADSAMYQAKAAGKDCVVPFAGEGRPVRP